MCSVDGVAVVNYECVYCGDMPINVGVRLK
jgi:hypothetical protein